MSMERAASLLVLLRVKMKVGRTWGSLEPFLAEQKNKELQSQILRDFKLYNYLDIAWETVKLGMQIRCVDLRDFRIEISMLITRVSAIC
ncbi:hypothetical protein RHMOL_Rhmol08G0119700 [Rhododendron molle]|uniref:Uncharacterized protein n=1 Tax=Rhododendron molle TaxID=49168 RepID=A0ACC0MNR2_RHOML|nr:hypothetical protein RHMOL_Rhmol08G0119700 [Rhododendron molle]